jgi:hypothetical protein
VSKHSNIAAPCDTHGALLDLHTEIKNDSVFKELCLSHGLLCEDIGTSLVANMGQLLRTYRYSISVRNLAP